MDSPATIDLNKSDKVTILTQNGLIVHEGETEHLKVVENPSTGYQWELDERSIDGIFEVTTRFVTANQLQPKEKHVDENGNLVP